MQIIAVDFSIWNSGFVLFKEGKITKTVLIKAFKKNPIRDFINKDSAILRYKKGDLLSFSGAVQKMIDFLELEALDKTYLVLEGGAFGFFRKGLLEQIELQGVLKYLFLKHFFDLNIRIISPSQARKILFKRGNLDKQKAQNRIYRNFVLKNNLKDKIVFFKKDREHILDALIILLSFVKKEGFVNEYRIF